MPWTKAPTKFAGLRNHLDKQGTASSSEGWLVSPGVRAAIAELDATLQAAVATHDPDLREMAYRLVALPGKRLRPSLALLAGELLDAPVGDELWLHLAAGVELLHIGSLYHDDIMDHAVLRRGEPTAHQVWGAALAATAGTYVTTRGIALLPRSGPILTLVSQALLEMCTGQLREAHNTYKLDVAPSDYLEIISKKTAALFELPCRLGATFAGASPQELLALARYGRHLGIAFQIADDALDLQSDLRTTGKPVQSDLPQGTYSLSVLLAATHDDATERELRNRLHAVRVGAAETAAVVELLEECGAIEAAFEVAAAHHDRAIEALEAFVQPSPARESMERLAEYAKSRAR